MDIKSKKTKRGALIIAILMLTAAVLVAVAPKSYSPPSSADEVFYDSETFVRNMYQSGLAIYYDLMVKQYGQISPVAAFFPELYAAYDADQGGLVIYEESDDFDGENPAVGVTTVISFDYIAFEEYLNELLDGWRRNRDYWWGSLEYYGVSPDGYEVSSGVSEFSLEVSSGRYPPGKYDYCALFSFDGAGGISDANIYGTSFTSEIQLRNYDAEAPWGGLYSNFHIPSELRASVRSGISLAFAVPIDSPYYTSPIVRTQEAYEFERVATSGFALLYFAVMVLSALLGVIYVVLKKPELGIPGRLYLEFAAVAGILSVGLILPSIALIICEAKGRLSLYGVQLMPAGKDAALVSLGLLSLISFVAVFMMFTAVVSVLQIFVMGVGKYFRERVVTVHLARFAFMVLKAPFKFIVWFFKKPVWNAIFRLYNWLTEFDLTKPMNRAVLNIVLVNFLILAVMCGMWVFGIFTLMVYTVILYYFLRRYAAELSKNYKSLLYATGEMAGGRLDVKIEEDLGVFTTLGDELEKIQRGFRKAVNAEIKSQNMKAELVTNVSHDLKTPLTAIITYVDLLKDENIKDEDRRQYIDTLDKKSQRLKRLIDDLFEMSRATTGDLSVFLTAVDLPALIRQVELEVEDEIKESGIEFRHTIPDEKIEVRLDGEKTSRIFENLIINVTKYAMPGTRAYIDVKTGEGMVTVEIKNISKEELSFEDGDITDRFVRGDRARNTEGSGLGLAIAKNFAELQGGSLKVATDGDLFKATVSFPLAE